MSAPAPDAQDRVLFGRDAKAGVPTRFRFAARRLNARDVERVYRLHRGLLEQAPESKVFKPESRQFFERHIEAAGQTLGVFVGPALIAYGIVGLPVDARYNFGVAFGLEAAEWPRVAHLDGCGVRPQWRGNGLQRWLAARRIALAAAANRRHILSTAAPANRASCRNLLGAGLTIRCLQPMFGGLLRYLFYRDLRQADRLDPATALLVAVADLDRQQNLLARGYRGYALHGSEESARILYGRPDRAPP